MVSGINVWHLMVVKIVLFIIEIVMMYVCNLQET